ncbi:uncharacterized protein PAC_13608 [Phialocephala subalpina]|uniref:Peptidase C19 ubiquitin carboxyl-terminal hydrolase domain-containing protein n=1 Tax=Phialocephala subalpina TaxID=576137 RepID=A0A1L7XFA5_9HELO|nr:uncharacterized protein PAC_13608 [Phialocephala subalpina]
MPESWISNLTKGDLRDDDIAQIMPDFQTLRNKSPYWDKVIEGGDPLSGLPDLSVSAAVESESVPRKARGLPQMGGLTNVGSTCFVNVAIHATRSIKPLCNLFTTTTDEDLDVEDGRVRLEPEKVPPQFRDNGTEAIDTSGLVAALRVKLERQFPDNCQGDNGECLSSILALLDIGPESMSETYVDIGKSMVLLVLSRVTVTTALSVLPNSIKKLRGTQYSSCN